MTANDSIDPVDKTTKIPSFPNTFDSSDVSILRSSDDDYKRYTDDDYKEIEKAAKENGIPFDYAAKILNKKKMIENWPVRFTAGVSLPSVLPNIFDPNQSFINWDRL